MPGLMMTSPGPFTDQNRPSWNTTPRSYSRSTRSAVNRKNPTPIRSAIPKYPPIFSPLFCSTAVRRDFEHQTVDRCYTDFLSTLQWRRGPDLPVLAMDQRPALSREILDDLARGPDHFLAAAYHRALARLHRHAHH